MNQSLTINNTTSGASSYAWDFCSGDLSQTPTVTNLVTLPSGNIPLGITVVQDGSNWYGFVTNRGGGELFRLDLGSSPTTATPVVVNLGNPSGAFNTPDKIRLIKEAGKWYGLVTNDIGNSLVRLSFGTSLANTPTAVDLGGFGVLNRPRGVEIMQDQSQVIAVVTNLGDNTVQLINFGTSITNTPSQTLSTAALPGASVLVGVSVVRECNRWVGVVVSVGNNRLFKLDFGSHLFSQPVVTDITNGYSYGTPLDIQLMQDRGEYLGLLCSDSGQLYKLNFGSSLSGSAAPKVSNLGSFGGSIYSTGTLAVVKDGSQWSFWTVNYGNNQVTRGLFPNNCSVSQPLSTEASPQTVAYSKPGKYYIDLTAYDANGNARTVTDSVTIVGVATVDFSTNKQCLGNQTQFFGSTAVPTDIASWSWNFGETLNPGDDPNIQNPVHQFSGPGTYQVTLTITDKRGCSSSITKAIGINNKKPTPLFNYLTVYCPDNTVQFTDISSPFSGETINKWQWNFGDPNNPGAVSTQQNPQYTYSQVGTYQVSLTIFGSSGCDATIEKEITVSKGTAGFTLADTVCVNQSLTINNTTSGASSYAWDFCSGDLSQTPTVTNLVTLPGGNAPVGITVVQDGSNWYGFVTNRGGGELFRLDLGSSPTTATPVVVNLGNPSGAFNTPDKIRLIKEAGKWYGLVTNDIGNSLVRLSFGTSLANTPTAVDLGGFGVLNRPRGVEIMQDQSQVIAVVTNLGDNTVQLINFGTSITNTPSQTLSTAALPGASVLVGVSVVRECNRWVGVVVSVGNNRLFKLDFGSHLFSQPVVTDITNGYSYGTPVDIQLMQDRGEYLGLLCSDSGQLYKLNFGSSLSGSAAPKVSNLGSFGGSIYSTGTLAVVKDGSQWSFWTVNYGNNQVTRGLFPNNCSVSQPLSTEVSPQTVAYSKPGKYYIDLTAYDANGNARTVTDSILVKSTIAPTVSFTTDDQCTQLATKFFGPSQDVSSWRWDFGDTNLPANSPDNTSTKQNPTHQYSKEGAYLVTLAVQSGNGCSNRITQSVIIYNNQKPKPAFAFPNQVCSFAELQFTDQSIAVTGDSVRNWRWDFGDGQLSTSRNPVHTYTNGGDYTVSLSVSGISGCDTTITQTVNILPGANTNFSYANVCIGNTVQFTNLTSPEGDWLWDFGDPGSAVNTSTDKDPQHYYAKVGTYTVQLSATTTNGCVVSRQQQIKVRRLPTVDFIASKVCANSPVTFTISALDADTTIAYLAWDFGDPGSADNLSSEESPVHTFTKGGSYTVRLTITTSAGCQGSVSHLMDISEPSKPGFTVSASCVGLPVSFTDSSVAAPNDALNRWTWNFGDNSPVVTVRNPVHTFANPGTYSVKLIIEGSQSNCQNTITKSVTVFPQPQVSFSTTPSCRDYAVQFTDNSTIANDRIQSWEWNFGGEGTSTDPNPVFNFNRTGTFAVSLKVTTANGCNASTSKTVTVDLLPEADFRFSPDFQAPPIEVKFINDSRRASHYEWDFGDGSPVSTDLAPSHTYQEIGTYPVRLLAFGGSGCADTLIKTVNVAIVIVDAQMKSVIANQTNGATTTFAEIVNAGTVPLTSLELVLQSGTAVDIQEKWTGSLNPKQSLVYQFKAQLLRSTLDEFPYLCVTARNPNNQEDARPLDNRSCASSADGITVLPAYPNPASTRITLPFILPEATPVAIYLYDAQGKRLREWHLEDAQTGYNELNMETGSLTGGLYLIHVMYQGQLHGQRVVKTN